MVCKLLGHTKQYTISGTKKKPGKEPKNYKFQEVRRHVGVFRKKQFLFMKIFSNYKEDHLLNFQNALTKLVINLQIKKYNVNKLNRKQKIKNILLRKILFLNFQLDIQYIQTNMEFSVRQYISRAGTKPVTTGAADNTTQTENDCHCLSFLPTI